MKRGEEGTVLENSLASRVALSPGKLFARPFSASDTPDFRDKLDTGYDI